jgi:hypothetical protein
MELIIILFVPTRIVLIVWKVRTHNRALKNAALAQAWREVLDDPDYMNRRRYEERKRDEARAHKAF